MSRRARACGWGLILLAAAAVLAVGLLTAHPRSVREIAQERWTHATAPLGPDHLVSQTMTVQRSGLNAIEVMAARYRPDEQLPADAEFTLFLERVDRPASATITVTLPIAHVRNNQRLRFSFPPQLDSAGGLYRLTLQSDRDHGVGVWASSHEGLAGGRLYVHGAPEQGDLVMSTFHAYPLARLLRDLPGILRPWLGALPAAVLLLSLPGLALLAWLPPAKPMHAMLAAAWLLATGLSFWPLLLLWTTTLGLRMTALAAWGILAALAVATALGLAYQRRVGRSWRVAPLGWPEATLAMILLVAVVVRLVQARGQIVPVWVDGVHHTMVTQLIAQQGFIPRTGEPFISIAGFHYHYGFHAGAAAWSWLTGLEPYRAVLGFGQLLAALAGLSVYALTVRLIAGRRDGSWRVARWAGTLAAAVPSFLTFMPAYYVSWARYTQLAGLVILPVLLVATWDLLDSRPSLDRCAGALLLIAGLALTHYRVLVFYMVFWVVYIVAHLVEGALRSDGRRIHPRARASGAARPDAPRIALYGAALAAGSLLLIAPWVSRMVTGALLPFGAIYGQVAAAEGVDTSVPMELLRVEGTMTLLMVAGLGWLWAVIRGRWRLVFVGVWSAVCVLVSDVGWLGLRGTWIIHGTSAAISYWLPAGVLVGWLGADLAFAPIRWIPGPVVKRRLAVALELALLLGLTAASIGSVWGQMDRVNEVTVLVRESDLPAIGWVRDNLPADSLILVNTRPWLGEIRMGSDAGWWLPYLTGHSVTYPSVLYTHGKPAYRDPISELASAVDTATALDDPTLLRMLADAGVTHVFVGTRGGPLEPPRLAEPHYVELFRHGPTRVYRFDPPAP